MRACVTAALAAALTLCLIPSTAIADNVSVPPHIDLAPIGAGALVTNSGTNKVDFSTFGDGDIIVCTDPTSLTGHAGLFDARYYSGIDSYAVISANVTPRNGVQREKCAKFRSFDRAYGLRVPSFASRRTQARDFASSQIGKPYSLICSKTDLRSFYCSKVAWVAWHYAAGIDLDGDGGYWVWPIDLVTSRYTKIFGLWT